MRRLSTLAHAAWRTLPRGFRQDLFRRVTRIAAPAKARNPAGPGPVAVAGPLGTRSGLGVAARLQLAAFQQAGLAASEIDFAAAFMQADEAVALAPPTRPAEAGALLLHANGPYAPYALLQVGRRRLAGKQVVGYWAWELPRIPDDWRIGFASVHEIWVPSRFTLEAVGDAPVPVRVVPYPAALAPRGVADRAGFDLAPDQLAVLSVFDMASAFARKNPLGAIQAFRQAFAGDRQAVLLLKVSNAERAPQAYATLRAAIGAAANIRLLAEKWPHERVLSLIASCDVLLSLHRAEGFGLVPAEAMLAGRPVVATGWSGNLDFMNHGNSALVGHRPVAAFDPQGTYDHRDQCWADPDIDQAADWLRRLADDAVLRRKLGEQARVDTQESLGLQAFLNAIGSEWLARWTTPAGR